MAVAGERGAPVFGLAVALDGPPPAPAMRAGADAGVILVAPVSEIVAALLARPGMVRDFVGGETRVFGHRLRRFIEDRALVRIGRGQFAARGHGGEAGAGLDGALVEREVAGAEGQGPAKLVGPGLLALLGPRINEVEADPIRRRPKPVASAPSPATSCSQAEEAKRSSASAAGERDPVDPCAGQIGEARASTEEGFASSVISIPGANPQCASAPHQGGDVAGGISEGGAATEEDRGELRPGSGATHGLDRRGRRWRQASWSTVSRTWLLKSQ